MSSFESVYGHGVQFDAAGNPIERGFGNLTDRAKATAAAVAASAPTAPVVASPAALPEAGAAPAAEGVLNKALHAIEEIAHDAEAVIAAEIAKL